MESQPAVTEPELRSGKQGCRIEIGAALLARTGELIHEILIGPHCAIISDSTVAPLFGDRVKQRLTSSGFQPTLITIPAGEQSKTLAQAETICDQMIAARLDRQAFVIGLGGGWVSELSGFVAWNYERCILTVQIITTLLT